MIALPLLYLIFSTKHQVRQDRIDWMKLSCLCVLLLLRRTVILLLFVFLGVILRSQDHTMSYCSYANLPFTETLGVFLLALKPMYSCYTRFKHYQMSRIYSKLTATRYDMIMLLDSFTLLSLDARQLSSCSCSASSSSSLCMTYFCKYSLADLSPFEWADTEFSSTVCSIFFLLPFTWTSVRVKNKIVKLGCLRSSCVQTTESEKYHLVLSLEWELRTDNVQFSSILLCFGFVPWHVTVRFRFSFFHLI